MDMTQPPYFIVNVEAVVCRNNSYLIIERSDQEEHAPGMLSIPGGKVDLIVTSPDALEQALRRECLEEVGLRLQTLEYLESKTFIMDTGVMCLSVAFLCRDFFGTASAKSPDEVKAVHWLTWAEIIKNPQAPPWTIQSVTAAERRMSQHEPKTGL